MRGTTLAYDPTHLRQIGLQQSPILTTYTAVFLFWENNMPYLLGWLLGVPVIVLVILYLVFH
jgi:hypothetical protein